MVRSLLKNIWHIPRKTVIALIRIYQMTLSPDHGPLRHVWKYGYCRHEPTCSEYAVKHLYAFGFVLGTLLALRRVISCNPFAAPSDEKMRTLAASELHLKP